MLNFSFEQSSDLRLICINRILFIPCFFNQNNNFIAIFHIWVWCVVKNMRKMIVVCFSHSRAVCCLMQQYAALCSNKWNYSIGTLFIWSSMENWTSSPKMIHHLLLILLLSRKFYLSDFFTSRQKKDENANIRHCPVSSRPWGSKRRESYVGRPILFRLAYCMGAIIYLVCF